MTVTLHERGVFSWTEWSTCLGQAIERAASASPADGALPAKCASPAELSSSSADSAYLPWLDALETLLVEKNIGDRDTLVSLARAWARAAQNTPHGQPIVCDTSSEI